MFKSISNMVCLLIFLFKKVVCNLPSFFENYCCTLFANWQSCYFFLRHLPLDIYVQIPKKVLKL